MSTLSVVAAELDVGDQLTALMRESRAYQGMYATILDGYRITASYLDRHPTFVAVTDTVVGFYSLIPRPPELDLLFVADSAQGLGVGTTLVSHMLDQAATRNMTSVRCRLAPTRRRLLHPPRRATDRHGATQPTQDHLATTRTRLRRSTRDTLSCYRWSSCCRPETRRAWRSHDGWE